MTVKKNQKKINLDKITKTNSFSLGLSQLKVRAFRYLTKKTPNYFFRGGDISIGGLTEGVHEPQISELIRIYADAGYKDFLIDIGANIGLISCQTGKYFSEVHMYEPNPICCHVIDANTKIARLGSVCQLHRYGLGGGEREAVLVIPTHNWGGAFIDDSSNVYSKDVLASKDGFSKLEEVNYSRMSVRIKDATSELRVLLNQFMTRGLVRGVIKIDVEGYELEVLKGIAAALPPAMSVHIIFESWISDFPLDDVIQKFNRTVDAKFLDNGFPWRKSWPNIFKALCLLVPRKIVSTLIDADNGNLKGDIVLHVR